MCIIDIHVHVYTCTCICHVHVSNTYREYIYSSVPSYRNDISEMKHTIIGTCAYISSYKCMCLYQIYIRIHYIRKFAHIRIMSTCLHNYI